MPETSKTVNSNPVSSPQTTIHPRLSEVLTRHQNHPDQTPIAPFSHANWSQVHAFAATHPSLILDLGCGTGESSQNLAHRYPDSGVLGLDRSSVRLGKVPSDVASNYLHLRGDQYDLVRLMRANRLRADKIYLLYPNPSPKPEHLKRRWHAHPIWPTLLDVTDSTELRTNWSIYAEEFAFALQASGWTVLLEQIAIDAANPALSLFEAKYARSGHALWRVLGQVASQKVRPESAAGAASNSATVSNSVAATTDAKSYVVENDISIDPVD